MAVRELARLGSPILRKRAEGPKKGLSAEYTRIAADLTDTLRSQRGVGLSAPQIRESARVIAIEIRSDNRYEVTDLLDLMVVVEPEIEVIGDRTATFWEGCLSIPELRGPVTRNQEILLRGRDLQGVEVEYSLEGFAAVVAQHEVDHLDGILFIDRMADLLQLSYEDEYRRHQQGGGESDSESSKGAGEPQ